MNFLTSSSVRELFGERTTYATGTSPASASGYLGAAPDPICLRDVRLYFFTTLFLANARIMGGTTHICVTLYLSTVFKIISRNVVKIQRPGVLHQIGEICEAGKGAGNGIFFLTQNQNRQVEAFDFFQQLGNGDDELRATILDLFGKLWNCIHWIHGRGNGTGGDGAQEAEWEVDGVGGEDKNDIVFPNTQLMLQAMSDFRDLGFQLCKSQGPAGVGVMDGRMTTAFLRVCAKYASFLYFLAALTLFVAVVSRTLEASACSPVGRESANPRLFVVAVGFLQFLAALTLSVVVASRTPDAFACSPLLHTRDSSSPRLASKKQRDIDTIVYGERS
nr:hypothetical protein CR513_17414 [Ipomoea trifida]